MARCLIVGCGCRGRSLARELVARGHAVRGTTRDPTRVGGIEAVGAEALVGDPDRLATLARAFDHVGVACLLLGSATGSREQLEALHGSRLEMLLTRMIDTTVRGVVYESAGSVDRELLATGAARVREACEGSLIPYVLLGADPGEPGEWLAEAGGAVEQVLAAP
jgi:nucleoside-diphosphate-sugar epimerase